MLDPRTGADLVAAAAARALCDARWEALDLGSRRSPEYAADLLRARASELALSPAGRLQITSVALERAAADIDAGAPPLACGVQFLLQHTPTSEERLRIQREVFSSAELDDRPDSALSELEADRREENPSWWSAAGSQLAVRLLEDAHLHRALWDDPRIPAGPQIRRLMLCSVPRLIDRSRVVDPLRLSAVRTLLRRREPLAAA